MMRLRVARVRRRPDSREQILCHRQASPASAASAPALVALVHKQQPRSGAAGALPRCLSAVRRHAEHRLQVDARVRLTSIPRCWCRGGTMFPVGRPRWRARPGARVGRHEARWHRKEVSCKVPELHATVPSITGVGLLAES